MRFLEAEACPVPARASSRPGADGPPTTAQGLDQHQAGRINRGSIPQRTPGACLHLGMAEFVSCLVSFGCVAAVAGKRQIADAMGTAPRVRSDVIDLERNLRLAAVRAPVRVLEQQVGSHLPSSQLPVLVLDARDLRVLKQLGVEADLLDLDAADGGKASIAPGPGEDVAQAGEQRGRQPAIGFGPVGEAGRAVTQIGTASAPPSIALGLLASMNSF